MAKCTKAKGKDRAAPRSPPPPPAPEELLDLPLEVVFGKEANGPSPKESPPPSDSAERNRELKWSNCIIRIGAIK